MGIRAASIASVAEALNHGQHFITGDVATVVLKFVLVDGDGQFMAGGREAHM
ncbi:hypothetical protein K239x_09140 [Planctomycetes bacterium K23_9]|uniref:Uncharacterized protein n=1 Tax=Stieleria marina TaxID=1930275 RepID=A0A517NPB5_9BACT|nr:hypothetical protein K239x_09140 [Planctomycetes bacterium K23_9]